MADLRALTLWPEWAWAIHHLDKRVENRGWPIPAGEWFALHAGKSPTGPGARPSCAPWPPTPPTGSSALGIARYRTPLQRDNGRDHRLDATEEAARWRGTSIPGVTGCPFWTPMRVRPPKRVRPKPWWARLWAAVWGPPA